MTPNDGLCHLNRTGYYTYSTVQDYPSIGHINHIAKQNSVSIIWAVTQDKFGLYEGLSELVAGSRAGKLSKDSSNIGQAHDMFSRIFRIRIYEFFIPKYSYNICFDFL